MSSSVTDISMTAPNAGSVNQLNPRQRVEALVDKLPTAGSVLGDAQSSQPPARSELEEPLQRVNEAMSGYGVQFEISDPPGERMITRLVDRKSGEVIRQMPPEEMLRMAERIDEALAERGGLLSEEA